MRVLSLSLIFIIPIIALISGLSLGVIIPLFMMFSLYLVKDELKVNLSNFRLEYGFFGLLLISCFWAINPVASLVSFIRTFSIVFVSYLLITNAKILEKKISIHKQHLTASMSLAMILFFFEVLTGGVVSSLVRTFAQDKESSDFYLHYMDRGCSVLAMLLWVAIVRILHSKKEILAVALYAFMFIAFDVSDSLAAFVGIVVSGIVFLLTRYSFFKKPMILSLILVVGSVLFIALTLTLNPHQIAGQAKDLPISAKHRLFIWDFASDKAMERPIFGFGHGASRQIEAQEDEVISYQGYELDPLPTHPHNNLVQIFLENGVVGLLLYLALMVKYLFSWHRFSKNSPSLMAAGYSCFASFFVISMISFNMWQSWWLASFLFAALMMVMSRKE
jgi:O-antigen ligase